MERTFTKYFYILLMFIVSFIAMYKTEVIGFGLVFAVQTIYTIVFMIEIIKDLARNGKALVLSFPKTDNDVSIPLYWILLPGILLQFAASLLTVMSSNFLQKKYNSMKLDRNLRWNIDRYKWMFITVTFALLGLTYSYTSDFNNDTDKFIKFASSYKSLLIILFVISAVFPIMNVFNASNLSKIIVTSTDG